LSRVCNLLYVDLALQLSILYLQSINIKTKNMFGK